MGLFDRFKKPSAEAQAVHEASKQRQTEITHALQTDGVAESTRRRLEGSRSGTLPWIATLTPAELLITRSHGIRPIASVSATCWLHYGFSWTNGHSQGWETALQRLREEARAAGANAVLDVKMRTVPIDVENSMDFTLVGTAVKINGLPPNQDPIIATVPALEFVKLLEADIVPTGIAIGAHYEWMTDWRRTAEQTWMGNSESRDLSNLWEVVRQRAHAELRQSAQRQGNGVLAHLNFSQMFEREVKDQPREYLGRHIVIATVVDAARVTRIAPLDSYFAKFSPSTSTTVTSTAAIVEYDKTFQRPSPEQLSKGVVESVFAALDRNGFNAGGFGGQTRVSLGLPPVPHEFRMVVDMHTGKTPLTGTTRHHQSYASNEKEGAI